MQITPQNIDAATEQVERMLDIAHLKSEGLDEIVKSIDADDTKGLMTGIWKYAMALRFTAEMEIAGFQSNLNELKAIKQHMDSGIIVPPTGSFINH